MPHIDLPEGVPGIRSLFDYRPETARPLLALADALLGPDATDGTLSRGERELIAAYVSRRNGCEFCETSHSAFAAVQLDDDYDLVEAVKDDPTSAAVTPKLRALLAVAAQVQEGGRAVGEAEVAAARHAGATDVEIHDAVLIAAAFCMFNRYVDGLAAWSPTDDPRAYEPRARQVAAAGYAAPPTP